MSTFIVGVIEEISLQIEGNVRASNETLSVLDTSLVVAEYTEASITNGVVSVLLPLLLLKKLTPFLSKVDNVSVNGYHFV